MKNSSINIRLYKDSDHEAAIELFRLNTPEYFAAEEEKELSQYLKEELELYYVIEADQIIVGCGGINFSKDKKEAIISWDFFHPDQQGKGFGTQLLQYRLDKIHTFNEVEKIIVRTSQIVFPFYEKNGFKLLDKKKDFWAPGFDMYLMEHRKQ